MTREEDIWHCSECGQVQGRHDMWFDGLCGTCHDETLMGKVKLVLSDGKGNLTGKELITDLPLDLSNQNQKTNDMDWDNDKDNAMVEYEKLCLMSVEFADGEGFIVGCSSPWAEFRKLTDDEISDNISMCIEIYDRDKDLI